MVFLSGTHPTPASDLPLLMGENDTWEYGVGLFG